MQSIEIRIKETASYGDIEGAYEPIVSVQSDNGDDDDITIGTINKKLNDNRRIYFTLDKTQALVLSDVLIRLSKV